MLFCFSFFLSTFICFWTFIVNVYFTRTRVLVLVQVLVLVLCLCSCCKGRFPVKPVPCCCCWSCYLKALLGSEASAAFNGCSSSWRRRSSYSCPLNSLIWSSEPSHSFLQKPDEEGRQLGWLEGSDPPLIELLTCPAPPSSISSWTSFQLFQDIFSQSSIKQDYL